MVYQLYISVINLEASFYNGCKLYDNPDKVKFIIAYKIVLVVSLFKTKKNCGIFYVS